MVRPVKLNHRALRPTITLGATMIVTSAALLSQPAMAFAQEGPEVPAEQSVLVAASVPEGGGQEGAGGTTAAQEAVSYDYNAKPYDPATGSAGAQAEDALPGVYVTKITDNEATASAENPQTIGIPSIADANLPDAPTTESPAIIQGAAVGYEEKTGAVEYKVLKERDAPYSYFRYTIIDEQGQDGTVHKKLSGFDGTYVIVRVDLTDYLAAHPEVQNGTGYLHVLQEDNNALLVAIGATDNTMVGQPTNEQGVVGNVQKTGAYSWDDLLDKTGADTARPYLDVILFATAANVAGADASKEGALTGDVPLHLYVDGTKDYDPDLKYDPTSQDTQHITKCLAKFYRAAEAATAGVSNYLFKGSDLALETMVEDSGGANKDTGTTYWSLTKSMEKPYYDQEIDKSPDDPNCGRTIKLMSEVAIVDSLDLEGTGPDNLKKRTLDVNSFDIQVAKNSASDNTGFTLKNAWLTLADKSKTTGAEFAIGNNAKMVVDQGGKLIIDESCQLEVEWDGGTVAPGQQSDTLNNGMLDLRAGGEVVNNGVISIEGTEGKPYQPGTQPTAEKGYGEMTIRPGATLTNNGCMIVNGRLYNLGTLVNNGRYDDTIVSNDPDKGLFAYHRGIQVAWKDDVTQPGVMMGELHNGLDRNGATVADALLRNVGDILLAPGKLLNYGTLVNEEGAHIYLAAAEEALIPIEPTAAAPTVTYQRIKLNPPVGSTLENYGTIINRGDIVPATVEILDNSGFGKLTVPGNHPELFNFLNYGIVINEGFIWGWGTRGMKEAGLAETGDLRMLGALAGALALAAASAAVIAFARRRVRS